VLANGGLILVQSADRLAVSFAYPSVIFAQYSLAGQHDVCSRGGHRGDLPRVFLACGRDRCMKVARESTRTLRSFLVLAWSLLLPYFFVLEVFVRRFLPKYVPGLGIAGILLLGVSFLAGIQILHMSLLIFTEGSGSFTSDDRRAGGDLFSGTRHGALAAFACRCGPSGRLGALCTVVARQ